MPANAKRCSRKPTCVMLINEIAKLFHDRMREKCERLNFKPTYQAILRVVAHEPGLSQLEIAGRVHLAPPTVSLALQKMEAEDLIRENGGWPYHLLTEDIEFSVSAALKGKRIGYCEKAVIYDEQPVSFKQSWDQRLRWSKGFFQVDVKYGLGLIRGCFRSKMPAAAFSCYDMLMTVAPGMLLTLLGILFNAIILAACLGESTYIAKLVIDETAGFVCMGVVNFYMGLFLYGLLTTAAEWKHIHASSTQKILYLFTFPLFMFTYVPISITALFKRVEWKPIYHGAGRRRLPSQS